MQLQESIETLRTAIDGWENKYILRSPIDGRCVFIQYWRKNQIVASNEKVMAIVPVHGKDIIGSLQIPTHGFGKVKQGQEVIIRLNNYPYMEFGVLKGFIKNISTIPNKDFYYAEVDSLDGMTTTYGIEIECSQSLSGTAEIITEDTRLLYRLIRPVKSLVDRWIG